MPEFAEKHHKAVIVPRERFDNAEAVERMNGQKIEEKQAEIDEHHVFEKQTEIAEYCQGAREFDLQPPEETEKA